VSFDTKPEMKKSLINEDEDNATEEQLETFEGGAR
jgi:hypothetical protein